MKFTSDIEFKRLLDEKKQDILQRTRDGVQETPQFKRLFSLFAESRRKNEEQSFRLVLISESDLLNLCDDAEVKIELLFKSMVFLTNSVVYVNSNLSVVNHNNDHIPQDNNDARRFFTKLSQDTGLVVFSISPNAIVNYFISGNDFGGGVFYSDEAQKSYEEMKTIENLQEVLDDYRIKLTHQDTYLKFFVSKSHLIALHDIAYKDYDKEEFMRNYKHLLRNKPEELFREDMRTYIDQHMRVVVSREVLLEDLDRLDIKFTDEMGNDLYFIEVKWVGESIHANGQKLGTEYNANPRIRPDAVRQVIGYIDELLKEKGKEKIKLGYLAVFDARKDDLPDTGEGISEEDVPEELRKHFHRFTKLPDFRVKNINPR